MRLDANSSTCFGRSFLTSQTSISTQSDLASNYGCCCDRFIQSASFLLIMVFKLDLTDSFEFLHHHQSYYTRWNRLTHIHTGVCNFSVYLLRFTFFTLLPCELMKTCSFSVKVPGCNFQYRLAEQRHQKYGSSGTSYQSKFCRNQLLFFLWLIKGWNSTFISH